MTPPDTVQQMVSATEIKAKELKEAGDWSRAAGCWASLGHHLNDIQLRNSSLFCFQQSLLLKVDPQVVYSFSQCYSVLGNRHAQMMVLEYYASLNTRGFNHVQALYQLGRYSLALKACGYCDAEPAVSMYIGLCCVKLGDLKQAIPSFNEAIEGYNPRDVNDEWSPTILNSAVYKELGLISLEAGDMSGYSEFMAKAHDINPSNAEIKLHIIGGLYRSGDIAGAYSEWQVAEDCLSQTSEMYSWLKERLTPLK